MINMIYVFNGVKKGFPSAVFNDLQKASEWISLHKLTGVLTRYPINIGVYDWAVENEYFVPKDESQISADFIANFSSSSLEHFHYEEGLKL